MDGADEATPEGTGLAGAVRPEEADLDAPSALLVRAAIHLPGFPLGAEALVDPNLPYIAGCLIAGYIVPVE